jgi:tRNA (cmo5U34)-methyltransferase
MSDKRPLDTLYSNKLADIGHFSFNDEVVSVFPDMIQRSVPGYSTILGMISDLAGRYVQANSRCYDLGCSLGAASLAMRNGINVDNCHIISIDNSQAMIDRCKAIIHTTNHRDQHLTPISLTCDDIEKITIENTSMVVLNFTLQFIPLNERLALLQKIYNGLLPGGILVLSEKVIFTDKPHQQLMTELYHNFKRENGYSDLEIAQKRTALEDVLRPETLEAHKERLKSVGFNSADTWFQCMTFASLIAIKP